MGQVQRRYVKFRSDSLDIKAIGFNLEEEDGFSVLPVDNFKLIEPFFTLEKRPNEYYPLVVDGVITGFRRKELFESQIVLNTEDETVRALRSYENFVARAKILTEVTDDGLTLMYDPNYFDSITNQENIDRLSLVGDRVYNLYVTRKGDPFTVYDSCEIQLSPFVSDSPIIRLPYSGPKDISVYVVAKD